MDYFLNYIQIFFLAIFLSFVIGKTIYIKRKSKINAIALSFRRDGLRHVMEIILFLVVNVWAFEVLLYSLNLDFKIFPYPFSIALFDNLYLKIIGFFLMCLGFTFFIWALINLGNSWRLGIDDKKPGKLVVAGIYKFCRHPIYLFFNLYFLGTFLIWGNLIFLIFWIIVTLILHYQIIQEEKFLIERYRQKYLKYMNSVGRYITFKNNFRQPEYLDK